MRGPSRVEGALAAGLSIVTLSGCTIDSRPSSTVNAGETYGDAIGRIDQYCDGTQTAEERTDAADAIGEYQTARALAVADRDVVGDFTPDELRRYFEQFPPIDARDALDCQE